MNQIRIGVVTDIHFGPDKPTRPGSSAALLVKRFVQHMNCTFKPDLIVDLGDRIQDSTSEEDRYNTGVVHSLFNQLNAPSGALIGNHDMKTLSKAEIAHIFGSNLSYRSWDFRGLHFVLLDTQDPPLGGIGGCISDDQLDWLKHDLAATSGPVLVFSHHPLDEQDISRNFHFDRFPHWAHAEGRKEARKILEASGRVLAAFNGHVHWSKIETIGSIPYHSVPSLTEAWAVGANSLGGCAEVVVTNNSEVLVTDVYLGDATAGVAPDVQASERIQ